MDTSLLRTGRKRAGYYVSHIFPVLVALTAGPGMLKAANLLGTYNVGGSPITSVTLTCNTATGPGPAAVVVVKPLAALTLTNIITVATTSITGTGTANVVLTAPGSQVLNAANSATGIQYTLSLASVPGVGCAGSGLGSTSVTFNFTHLAGTVAAPGSPSSAVTDVAMPATVAVTSSVSGLSIPATINLTCVKTAGGNYYPGPAQTITVSSTATGGTPFSYDNSNGNAAATWAVLNPVVPSGTATSGTPITFTVVANGTAGQSTGCNNLASSGSNTATTTIKLLNAPGPVQSITVNLTVSPPSASALVVSPTTISITCAKSGNTYTPNYAQTASVSAPSSTAFSIDTSGSAAWLSVTSVGSATATSSIPAQLSVTSLSTGSPCGGGAVGTTNTTTFHLAAPPASDKIISVSALIVNPTLLQASPAAPSLTYVKGSGTAGSVDVTISSTSVSLPSPFFSVNTATLPSWLRLDSTTGLAPKSLRFSSTGVADTLAPGTYSASVVISVSGYGDMTIPVTMLLTNKAPQLTVQAPPSSQACTPASATTFCIPWTIGQALPTPTITAISTDTPIAYTATTGGLLAPVIPAAQQSGLAYSFGTPINVSFSQQAFAAAQPGNTLTGTMTLTWGSPVSTVVITFQISVQSPGATITSYSPSTLPVQSAGSTPYTVTLSGTGFVYSTDPTQMTRVGVVTTTGQPMTFDTNIHVNVVNQSNITLTISIPSGSDPIPFAGGSFTLGVCNPLAGTCNIATSVAALAIGNNPIIQAVTSSSALLQNSSVSVAPYDMISIFGTNFCPNCTSTQVLTGSPDPVSLTYPTQLQFNSTTSNLSVTFQPHTGSAFTPTNAPILFATNGQINLMVPSAISAAVTPIDILVNYGPNGSLDTSATFSVSLVATDPGIFTIGADGQGSGAALDLNYNLIGANNPAGIRTGSGNSDVISIYMTGLGAPDGTGDNSAAASDNSGNGYVWSADCVTTASYLTSFNNAQTGTALTSLDGTVIIPSVLNTGRFQPCMVTGDITHLYIGGVDAASNITYAGWVAGTIAGLYQVNVKLPVNSASAFTTAAGLTGQSILQPVQLPVQVVTSSGHSQAGVTLWVAPRLKMVGPNSGNNNAADTVAATVGIALVSSHNSVTASQGTPGYTYAVTSGLLPSGLSIDPASGLISGTPAAGTAGSYTVTVTATDTANIPVTGTDTFVVTVAGGLYMTASTPTLSTFATPNNSVAQVTATSGVYPYHYSMAITSHPLPTGLAINPSTGAITTSAATPAGTYSVIVTAQDSTAGTPLTGTANLTIVVNMAVSTSLVGTLHAGSAGPVNTSLVSTGNTGTVSYALDAGTAALSWVTFNTATGIVSVTSSSVISSRTVTITATDGTAQASASSAGTGTVQFTLAFGLSTLGGGS